MCVYLYRHLMGCRVSGTKKRTRCALFLKVPEHPRGSGWGGSSRVGSLEHKQSSVNRVMALALLGAAPMLDPRGCI